MIYFPILSNCRGNQSGQLASQPEVELCCNYCTIIPGKKGCTAFPNKNVLSEFSFPGGDEVSFL